MNLTDRIRNSGLTFLVLPRGRAAGEIGVKYLLLLSPPSSSGLSVVSTVSSMRKESYPDRLCTCQSLCVTVASLLNVFFNGLGIFGFDL
jgi:hypothetical protein